MKKNDLLLDSTGYVLNLLEKILDANIEIKGINNIPKDHPRIFVANHFTRTEAILVPFAMYNLNNKKVSVIADDSLFHSVFGNLLKNIGALKKTDPSRNNIMLGNLLSGKQDCMIFPEGLMVKAKDIRKEGSHYCVNVDGACKRVYTGASFFALYSQLLREKYLKHDIKNQKKFQRKYFLKDLSSISQKETMIVPINISYSKIRAGENFLMRMMDNIFPEITEELKEEIEIESNIILNSCMTIQILKPISSKEILFNAYDKEKNHNKIINTYRYDLTQQFMTQVYENLCISFDHIFILSLFLYAKKEIHINHFKRLLYLIIMDIKNSKLSFHKILTNRSLDLIAYEEHEHYEDALKQCLKDEIITIDQDIISINKTNLLNTFTHDSIRLKNIMHVVLNEILIIKKANDIVKKYASKDFDEINKILYTLLLTEEKNEYEEDYNFYSQHEGIKDKKIGQPFLLEASTQTCVITVHGFSSAPKEVEKLSIYLYKKGLSVYAPRLKGHGTMPQDLKNIAWTQWYDSVSKAIIIATLKYKKVFVLGFSTGGLLSILSTKKNYKEFAGLICINAALNLNDIRIKALIPAVSFWNDLLNSFNAHTYTLEYLNNKAQNPHINYDKYYISSITQLSYLMKETKIFLKNCKTPIFVIQSKNDPVVNPSSAYEIYNAVESNDKKLLIIDSYLHVIITHDNETLFEEIKDFILK